MVFLRPTISLFARKTVIEPGFEITKAALSRVQVIRGVMKRRCNLKKRRFSHLYRAECSLIRD
jgi:hypothetical protein